MFLSHQQITFSHLVVISIVDVNNGVTF